MICEIKLMLSWNATRLGKSIGSCDGALGK